MKDYTIPAIVAATYLSYKTQMFGPNLLPNALVMSTGGYVYSMMKNNSQSVHDSLLPEKRNCCDCKMCKK